MGARNGRAGGYLTWASFKSTAVRYCSRLLKGGREDKVGGVGSKMHTIRLVLSPKHEYI